MLAFRRAVAALLVAVLLGCFVAPANAAPITPRMQFAYELANEHWGGPPTNCSSLDFEIVPNGSLGGADEIGRASIPVAVEPCFLYLVRELAPGTAFQRMCAVVFHETGHLHGLGHSSNPRAIMYPEVTFIPSACSRAGLWLMNHPRRLDAPQQVGLWAGPPVQSAPATLRRIEPTETTTNVRRSL